MPYQPHSQLKLKNPKKPKKRKLQLYGPPSKQCVALLGTRHDIELAGKFGVPLGVIWRWRTQRGIPAFDQSRCKLRGLTEEIIPLFGKLPDAQIAKQYGVSRQAIGVMRHRLGIPRATSR